MTKKLLALIFIFMTTTGCHQAYLDDPFYGDNTETQYPISMKDNGFVGGPTMVGDLVGCVVTVPFLPIYYPLKDSYKDDQDAHNSLNHVYGFIPRLTGKIVGYPLTFVKYVFYDVWFTP